MSRAPLAVGLVILSLDGAWAQTNWQPDLSFATNAVFNGEIFDVAVQSDKRIVVAGNFSEVNGQSQVCLARLHADGTWDDTFRLSYGFVHSETYANAVVAQSDGAVYVGGTPFLPYHSFTGTSVARILPDGTVDPAFRPPLFSVHITDMALQPDGKLLVVGQLGLPEGPSTGIVRLLPDGTFDPEFQPGTGIAGAGSIWAVCLASDNKIYVTGSFTSFNGTYRNRLARLNSDGSLDPAFTVQLISSTVEVRGLLALPNGDVLVGKDNEGVARISGADGSYSMFATDVTMVYRLELLGDGSVLIGGPQIHRFSADGILEQTLPAWGGYGLSVYGTSRVLVPSMSYEPFSCRLQRRHTGPPPPPRFDLMTSEHEASGPIHWSVDNETERMAQLQTSSNLIDWLTVETNELPDGISPWTHHPGPDSHTFYRLWVP